MNKKYNLIQWRQLIKIIDDNALHSASAGYIRSFIGTDLSALFSDRDISNACIKF